MKIKKNRGELIDISAEKEALFTTRYLSYMQIWFTVYCNLASNIG